MLNITCSGSSSLQQFFNNAMLSSQDADPGARREMESIVVGIYVIWHEGVEPTDLPEDVGVIIEGVKVVAKNESKGQKHKVTTKEIKHSANKSKIQINESTRKTYHETEKAREL